ncbi:hypothetical protein [Thioalkalivibrio sp. ALJ24]|uniref:hypothetical protein n=1 Tax=Thioalkalivibrio sp. ALJ24 TaxID=545276 RepID=UPI00037B12E8|nr:hypothetical protein [Thioalkalivibrio sp. ALJ24]
MFKRRAHLLVAAAGNDGRAARVAELAELAEQDGDVAEWLEVRPRPAMGELAREDLEWADLLVAVDAEAAKDMPAGRPPGCRPKYWQLPPASVLQDDPATFDEATHSALACMAGGMRMLARMDAEDQPDPSS